MPGERATPHYLSMMDHNIAGAMRDVIPVPAIPENVVSTLLRNSLGDATYNGPTNDFADADARAGAIICLAKQTNSTRQRAAGTLPRRLPTAVLESETAGRLGRQQKYDSDRFQQD